MTTFAIATHNPNKINELRAILRWTGNDGHPYTDWTDRVAFPTESATSYRINAIQKALAVSRVVPKQLILADDSGLQLAAYPDWLGVTTARDLAGCQGPTEYDQLILQRLQGQSRSFTMVCELACALDGEIVTTTRSILTGQVAEQLRGQYSHGFDRILIPNGEQLTLAEMPFDQRVDYLVRAKAIHQLLAKLKERL